MCRGVHLVMFTRPLHTMMVLSVGSAVRQFWVIFGIACFTKDGEFGTIISSFWEIYPNVVIEKHALVRRYMCN